MKMKFVFAGLTLLFFSVGMGQKAQTQKPNIIIILVDDMGYNDVGFNGSKDITTPVLDKLAAEGTVMTSAYVGHPFCGPSRASIMTGRYPQNIGTPYNLHDDGKKSDNGVPLSEPFMSNVLKDAGYYTSIIGKWHLGDEPQFQPNNRGFDEFFGFLGGGHKYFPEQFQPAYEKLVKAGQYPINVYLTPIDHNGKPVKETEYLTDAFSREAVRIVKEAPAKKKPFFMYLAYNAPHMPLEAKKEDLERFASIKDKDRQTYAAMVYAVDRGVGELVKALKETNQFDNTLIVFFSDNGGETAHGANNAPLKGRKGDTWEGGFRVPMFFHWPAKIAAGKQYNFPVSSLDLYPTFAKIADARLPKGKKLDGKDILKDVIAGSDVRKNDMIYSLRYRAGYCDVGGRLGDWKATKMGNKAWQLFNIKEDIGEQKDLSAQYPDKLKSMVSDIEKWSRNNVRPLWFYTKDDEDMWNDGRLPDYKKTFSIK